MPQFCLFVLALGQLNDYTNASKETIEGMIIFFSESEHINVDKIAAIFQTTFPNAFSWMKFFVFWLKFHWRLILRVQLTISSMGLDNGLAPIRRQAIISINVDPVHWRIYAARGGDGLNSNLGHCVQQQFGKDAYLSHAVNGSFGTQGIAYTSPTMWCLRPCQLLMIWLMMISHATVSGYLLTSVQLDK